MTMVIVAESSRGLGNKAKEFGVRRIGANSIALDGIRTELRAGLSKDFETMPTDQTALGRVPPHK